MAYKESYAGRINRKLNKKLHVVEVAAGREKADLVLKNATYVNVFCNQLSRGDIAVASGLIAGMGEHYEGEIEVDMGGKLVLPGFVDAHIHLESSLVSPKEFAKAVLPHGTTTLRLTSLVKLLPRRSLGRLSSNKSSLWQPGDIKGIGN